MLTDEQLAQIEADIQDGLGIREAIRETTGDWPSLQLLTWLRENHYKMLTDAKHGEGHTENEAAARAAIRGNG